MSPSPPPTLPSFSLTPKQGEAWAVLGGQATHVLLRGGSRSGKTFLIVRALVTRALAAPGSRHAILRFRFNACKVSVALDTFPAVMEKCWPGLAWKMNREDWYASLPGGSEIWFGGLDDKERTEKILGNEYASIFLNECSQIPWASRNIAVTRLAQRVMVKLEGRTPEALRPKMYYDMNPGEKSHWTYRLFIQKLDPDTRSPDPHPDLYDSIQINPGDNVVNLPAGYIQTLASLSPRLQRRFLQGEFKDATPGALFADALLDKWRVLDKALPDMQRIVVAVDPSGSGDTDNAENDAIGVIVAGLGTDGNAYVLEDLTVKAGPAVWGRVVTNAFDRHGADCVVGEVNYGGAMVSYVIQTARPRTPYRAVTATRGKVVRAEPISGLCEDGKIRMVGFYPELEEELAAFTTNGYTGDTSPNRADAFVWAMTELFPGIVAEKRVKKTTEPRQYASEHAWLAG